MQQNRPLLKIDHYKPFWRVIIYAKNSKDPIKLDDKFFDESTNDIMKIVTNKAINNVGTFALNFVFRRHAFDKKSETVESWYDKITPNDLVVIQLGRFKKLDIHDNNQYTNVFIGLVDTIKKSLSFAGDMKPKRQITITGKDLTKLLLTTTIYKNEFAKAVEGFQQVPEGSLATYFSDFPGSDVFNSMNTENIESMQLSGMMPNRVTTVTDAVDTTMNFFYDLFINVILKIKDGTSYIPIKKLLKYEVKPFKVDTGIEPHMFYFMAMSPFMLNVWDLLSKYSVPQPYNEIIIRENKEKVETNILVRGINEYIDYTTGEIKEVKDTTTHKYTEDDLGIITYDLGRTDEMAFSIYEVSPMDFSSGTMSIGRMSANSLTICPPNLALYGYRIFRNSTPYTTMATTKGEMHASFIKASQDISRSYAKLSWKLPNQEFGSLIVKGNAQFQIGDILEISYNNNTKSRFYISGVKHDFTPFYGSWITSLSVTRGIQL